MVTRFHRDVFCLIGVEHVSSISEQPATTNSVLEVSNREQTALRDRGMALRHCIAKPVTAVTLRDAS
jgi:hypothetical protein